jgi:hypothetical protein
MLEKAMQDGVIEALTKAGPIKKAMDKFSKESGDMLEKAMQDGVIDQLEGQQLAEAAASFGDEMTKQIDALGPLFDVLGQHLGDGAAKGAEAVKTALGSALNDAVLQNQSFTDFSLRFRTDLYNQLVGGLTDAFIQSAVINGALAGPLLAIQAIFDQIGKNQISIGEANIAIATQIGLITKTLDDPAFKAAFQQIIDAGSKIATGLGVTQNQVERTTTGLEDAAAASEDACAGKCALERDLANTYAGLTDLGGGRLGEELQQDFLFRVPGKGGKGDSVKPEMREILRTLRKMEKRIREERPIDLDGRRVSNGTTKREERMSRGGRSRRTRIR